MQGATRTTGKVSYSNPNEYEGQPESIRDSKREGSERNDKKDTALDGIRKDTASKGKAAASNSKSKSK